jgi:hypothetical protein
MKYVFGLMLSSLLAFSIAANAEEVSGSKPAEGTVEGAKPVAAQPKTSERLRDEGNQKHRLAGVVPSGANQRIGFSAATKQKTTNVRQPPNTPMTTCAKEVGMWLNTYNRTWRMAGGAGNPQELVL